MSYDFGIGKEHFNYTDNVSGMWYASEPEKGIRVIYGMTGTEAVPVLQNMRNHMESHWDEMIAMNPSNGWGSAEGALLFLNNLIAASLTNPDAVWNGD